MSLNDQKQAAIAQVKRNCQIQVAPVIEEQEIIYILTNYQLADVWATGTAYVVGNVIMPTVRNGHLYRCCVAGTSGTTEPTWPFNREATVLDGESDPVLLWQEAGSDAEVSENVFDIRGLSYDVWDMKAARAAVAIDQRTPAGGLSGSQLYDHCVAQRDKFAPILVG